MSTLFHLGNTRTSTWWRYKYGESLKILKISSPLIMFVLENKILHKYDENYNKGPRFCDHCRTKTGQYSGPADSVCNQQLSSWKNIGIFFHNLTNYDGHFIIRSPPRWDDLNKERGIEVIAKSLEKFTSFSSSLSVSRN